VARRVILIQKSELSIHLSLFIRGRARGRGRVRSVTRARQSVASDQQPEARDHLPPEPWFKGLIVKTTSYCVKIPHSNINPAAFSTPAKVPVETPKLLIFLYFQQAGLFEF
jgi:hypothetical protein